MTTGFSPAELLVGRTLRTPLKVLQEKWTAQKQEPLPVIRYLAVLTEVGSKLNELAQEREKKLKNVRIMITKEVGDMEFLRTPLQEVGFKADLAGTYAITGIHGNGTYTLHMPEFPRCRGTYHSNLLEKYISPPAECLAVSTVFMNDMMWSTTDTDNSLLEPGEHLSDQDRCQVKSLLKEYQDVLRAERVQHQ